MKKTLLVIASILVLFALMLFASSIFQVYQGGTGNNTLTAHAVLLGEGTSAVSSLTLGAHQVAVGATSADPSAKTIPDCQDTTGNHLNYTQSTDAFSCGTSSSGGSGGGGNTPFATPVAASSTIPYFGLAMWYSADCITRSATACSVPSNGTNITGWADRSGNWHDMQNNGGTCTFNTSQINSQPAVTGGCQLGLYASSVAHSELVWNGGITIFVVAKLAATGTNTNGTLLGGGSGVFHYRLDFKQSGQSAFHAQGIGLDNTADNGTGSTVADTNWHQLNMEADCTTANLVFRIDRAADSPTLNAVNCNGTISRGNSIGNILYDPLFTTDTFTGQIAEMLIYQRYLTSSEITQVETYLHGKYNL